VSDAREAAHGAPNHSTAPSPSGRRNDQSKAVSDAREIIARVAGELGARWTELDITQDEALYRRYWEKIPVTLIDGEQHDFWRVSEERLRAALSG
jgi:hypothetical protein